MKFLLTQFRCQVGDTVLVLAGPKSGPVLFV